MSPGQFSTGVSLCTSQPILPSSWSPVRERLKRDAICIIPCCDRELRQELTLLLPVRNSGNWKCTLRFRAPVPGAFPTVAAIAVDWTPAAGAASWRRPTGADVMPLG